MSPGLVIFFVAIGSSNIVSGTSQRCTKCEWGRVKVVAEKEDPKVEVATAG
jgi:hypothetical protein